MAAVPLSQTASRQAFTCICGEPAKLLGVWREHDERDLPIEGDKALVFIGKDHLHCLKRMDEHPRLYGEESGRPGLFPQLCGPCRFRRGDACTHPDLRANVGCGLYVTPDIGFNVIVCSRGRRAPLVRNFIACRGREVEE